MKSRTKRKITENARLTYGLTYILKDCADNIRVRTCQHELDKLDAVIDGTKEILQKLTDAVTEIEYMLYLEHIKY